MSTTPLLNLSPRQKWLVRESFESVLEYSDSVVVLFYGRLFELAPQTRGLFTIEIRQQARKLTDMLASIRQLDQTSPGADELQRRTKLFGECKRIEGETSGQFYPRLRLWLDREMPQTKSPLHAPRQTGE